MRLSFNLVRDLSHVRYGRSINPLQLYSVFRLMLISFFVMIVLAASLQLVKAAPDGGVVGTGTPGSCTEAALNAALVGGGNVTFNCGGPTTISIASVKTIAQSTSIDGGNVITLTGGLATPLLRVEISASLALRNITLMNAYNTNSSGAAIWSAGPLTLTHVTIKNSQTIPQYCGGALLAAGETQINNSTFENNVAGLGGGAICVRSQPGTKVQIANSSFFGNQATNPASGLGGALYVEYGTAVVDNSVFILNNAVLGGAIQVNNNAQLTMVNGSLSSNTAIYGGGIFAGPGAQVSLLGSNNSPSFFTSNAASDSGGALYNDGGTVQIANANFTANSAAPDVVLSGYGGAIANGGVMTITSTYFQQNQGRFGGAVFVGNNGSGANATIRHSSFYQNTATQIGGGLYTNIQTTTVAVIDSAFIGNSAGTGGGIGRFNTRLSIYNSSLTHNTATSGGGGMWVSGGPTSGLGGYVEVHDSTISTNTSTNGQGGGVLNQDLMNLENVTVKDNTNGIHTTVATRLHNTVLQNPGSLNCGGSTPSSAGGNFSTDTSCNLTGFQDQQGTELDPKLGPLTIDTFSITSYHMPQAGSPLINAATPACATRDQRGALRPDACDIGAVEFGGLLPRIYLPQVVK